MDNKNNFKLEEIPEPPEAKIPIRLTLDNTPKDDALNIKLSSETKKELEELAKKYNLKVSEVVRQLVKQGMEHLKSEDKK